MNYFTADYIFPMSSPAIKNGVVGVDKQGKISGLYVNSTETPVESSQIKKLDGIICPGFVNAHCHLELSYLKNVIPEGEGFVSFAKNLISKRSLYSEQQIMDAMVAAEQEMFRNGIVAVGDISNGPVSFGQKRKGKLFYHTFIELIGFNPAHAKSIFEKGLMLLAELKDLPGSLAPHAPYSISNELLKQIDLFNEANSQLISIHNQESDAENQFFREKKGDFVDFYRWLNVSIDYFSPTHSSSIQSYFEAFGSKAKVLLVHNTVSSVEDIRWANAINPNIYWCFCPNANQYIEKRLPAIDNFVDNNCRITLGTDSLASNHSLSILDEMITIQQKYPAISLQTLLEWATFNGAEFLGISNRFGSVEVGKSPGLNHLTVDHTQKLTDSVKVSKIG